MLIRNHSRHVVHINNPSCGFFCTHFCTVIQVVGVTTLDLMRSRAFIGERLGRNPRSVAVDVVGGHSGTTIVRVQYFGLLVATLIRVRIFGCGEE